MLEKIKAYAKLMRLNKPIGIWLLLWPTMWALWTANKGIPNFKILVIFILGVIIMRSAGCVINDIADRNFDGKVQRTQARPLVTGEVSLLGALLLFVSLCLLGFILVLQLNLYTIVLSFVALVLAALYPFTKRVTYFPQAVLGAAFGWSVPMAFSAALNYIPPVAWLIYAIAILWPVAYDSIYALMDKGDDVKIGVKSTVIYFGDSDISFIFLLQGLVILCLLILGILLNLGGYYYLSLAIVLAFMYNQYRLVVAKKFEQAFKNNHWVGLTIFLGIALSYYLSV